MEERLLPLVNKEIGLPIAKDLSSADDDIYIEEEIEKLGKENPVIANFIELFAEQTEDRNGTAFCGLIVYRLLRNQAEVDKMSREINLE